MHNNAIGPELCGNPANKANDFYGQRPALRGWQQHPPAAARPAAGLLPVRPQRRGRFELFKRSMDALLNPAKRIPKVTLLNEDVTMRIGPQAVDGTDRESCSASSSPSLTRSTGAASPPARWATSSTRSSWSTWCAPRPSPRRSRRIWRKRFGAGPARRSRPTSRRSSARSPNRTAWSMRSRRGPTSSSRCIRPARRDRERGSPLRRRPRCRQEGADRLPRNL